MNNNNGWWLIVAIAAAFVAVAGVTLVISSDIPVWAKYLILMR